MPPVATRASNFFAREGSPANVRFLVGWAVPNMYRAVRIERLGFFDMPTVSGLIRRWLQLYRLQQFATNRARATSFRGARDQPYSQCWLNRPVRMVAQRA